MQQCRVRFQPHPNTIPAKKNYAYYLELLGEEGTILRKLDEYLSKHLEYVDDGAFV
jgi:hypothetical protein